MLAILPDLPSKLWMHSKLIKWVIAFGEVKASWFQSIVFLPIDKTINGVFSQEVDSTVGD